MAVIASTNLNSVSPVTVSETTLGASDTLTYDASKDLVLVLRNETAGALTPVIDGDGAASVFVPGVGAVDISTGYTFPSIAAGTVSAIKLKSKREYLVGVITVTGGTGIVAQILEV